MVSTIVRMQIPVPNYFAIIFRHQEKGMLLAIHYL